MTPTAEEQLQRALTAQKKMQYLGFQIVETDPWVEIRLQGKDLKLEYSYGAVKEVFRRTGLTIGIDAVPVSVIAGEDVFLPMLLAGLQTHHADLFRQGTYDDKLEALAGMIPMRHKQYYVTCIQAAVTATEPDPMEMMRIAREANDETDQLPLALSGTLDGSGPDVAILDAPTGI